MIKYFKSKMRSQPGFLIFFIFLVLHLVPIFSLDVLLTLDGPSHLYNAKIFNEILVGNKAIEEFLLINSELVPNYTGHLLLSLLLSVSTPLVSLKAIHILYVVGIAFSFRALVLKLSPQNGKMTVLIFPIIFSAPFISGFYNFSLALILLLFTLFFWFRNNKTRTVFFYIKLSILFLLTYLSHSFTFAILCLSIGVIIITKYGYRNYLAWIKEGAIVFLSAIIPIALAISFVMKRESNYSYLTGEELWQNITGYKFLYTFSQSSSSWILTYVLFSLLGSVLFKKKTNLQFFYITTILLMFYFFLPDGVGYASVFSIRTLLICFMFFIIWLALQKRNRILQFIIIVLLLFYQNKKMNEFSEWGKEKSERSLELLKVADLIPANSIIKPIRKLNVWQYYHISNFLGVSRSQIILENYEAEHNYFPIKWKGNLEEQNKREGTDFFKTKLNNKEYSVDYLVVIGKGITENKSEIEHIKLANNSFPKVYQSEFITLYKVVPLAQNYHQ